MTPIPVFDGHNDVLLRLLNDYAADPTKAFIEGTRDGHLDLPRARRGGFVGGFFAMFPPNPKKTDFTAPGAIGGNPPLPAPLTLEEGRASTLAMTRILLDLTRAENSPVALCRSRAEIDAAIAAGRIAALMHIEGAEAIDANLDMLEVLYAAGLRSIGPVWSRANIFGTGVPFHFPASPDVGPGLTEAGKDLVRACDRLGMVIDLSHLNEAGFWDVAKVSKAPLVATHSNVHAICASARNLTDKQLDAIAESNGMVGLNFATGFLRPDGAMRADTDIEIMVRHLDYLIEKLGENRVGLGSDFDGANIPAAIGTVAGLPVLIDALKAHGYDEALIGRLACGNWLDLIERVIG
ncbi:Microsomal dipeptidase [Devosia sp. H5989]|nr:Microsomal dipeptidase [Devosia sp. H5989]